MGYSKGNTATVCLSERGYCHSLGYIRWYTATLLVTAKATVCLSVREGILPVSGLHQMVNCHAVGYSKGNAATVCLSERGYCHSLGYRRGYTATLLVTAKATVCLSERGYCHSVGYTRGYKYCHSVAYSRGETAIVCLSESGYCHSLGYSRGDTGTVCLSERGYWHSVGYSRGDTATVCLSENTHHVYKYTRGILGSKFV